MRIYKDRYYVLSQVPGISGFQRWHERELTVVTGYKAANYKLAVKCEYTPGKTDTFILFDGHLPDHCPRANEREMISWLDNNSYGVAYWKTIKEG